MQSDGQQQPAFGQVLGNIQALAPKHPGNAPSLPSPANQRPDGLNVEALGSAIRDLANTMPGEGSDLAPFHKVTTPSESSSQTSKKGPRSQELPTNRASQKEPSRSQPAQTSQPSQPLQIGQPSQDMQACRLPQQELERQLQECTRNSLRIMEQKQEPHRQPLTSVGLPSATLDAQDVAAYNTASVAAELVAAAWQQNMGQMGGYVGNAVDRPLQLNDLVSPYPAPWDPEPAVPPGILEPVPQRPRPNSASPQNAERLNGCRSEEWLSFRGRAPGLGLRTHLQDLQKVASSRVLLVRRINRLGFESAVVLTKHYSRYGCVDRVLVSHSHVKSQKRGLPARLRPSGLGFIVMSTEEEVQAILREGPEQVIKMSTTAGAQQEVVIRVQSFERREDGDVIFEDADPQGGAFENALGG